MAGFPGKTELICRNVWMHPKDPSVIWRYRGASVGIFITLWRWLHTLFKEARKWLGHSD